MTGEAYRWTASFGLFLGAVTTIMMTAEVLPFPILRGRLAVAAMLPVSLLGIVVSLVSIFLHPDHPDRESPLNHRAVGLMAVALTAWPWAMVVWVLWFGWFGPR